MKKNFTLLSLCAAAGALAQAPVPVPAPQTAPPAVTLPSPDAPRKPGEPRRANPPPADVSNLTRFDLNFPGGRPDMLVEALDKALGKMGAVNVVIHESAANVMLPAVRVRNATVADVFNAIQTASRREVAVPTSVQMGIGGQKTVQSYSYRNVQHQFIPAGNSLTDDTVWSFVSNEPEALSEKERLDQTPRETRYFTLREYLSDSLTVEDITTAIRIGWEMLKVERIPDLKFHKETGILITAGNPDLLDQIPAVLQQLPRKDDPNTIRPPRVIQRPNAPVAPPAPAAPLAPPSPAAPPAKEIPKPVENF